METVSEVTPVYPEWQKVIRQAQAEERREAREAGEAQEAAALKHDQQLAVLLGEALALFGIDAKPTTNRYQLDSIVFSLERVDTSLQRGAFFDFDLLIAYALEPKYEMEAIDDFYGYLHLLRVNETSNYSWTTKKAELANAIDRITRDSIRFMHQVDERYRTAPVTEIEPPTPAESLYNLIRQIVHDERKSESTLF